MRTFRAVCRVSAAARRARRSLSRVTVLHDIRSLDLRVEAELDHGAASRPAACGEHEPRWGHRIAERGGRLRVGAELALVEQCGATVPEDRIARRGAVAC